MSSFNDIEVPQKYGIKKSMLSKWKKDGKNIEDTAAQKHKQLLKKISRQKGIKTYSNNFIKDL